jgi:hypothetical protein
VDKNANDTFAFDLENRLDDFFSDSLSRPDEPSTVQEPPAPRGRALKGLKSTLLAIDWEITDDALAAFIGQVDALEGPYETDKVAHTLLRMLRSLGRYVRTHKANAHPDTIKRIMAVYSALERAVDDQLSPREKEKLLSAEVSAFRQLKQQIVASRAARPTAAPTQQPSAQALLTVGAVIRAIQDLESRVTAELGAIRKDLERLGKS